MTKGIIFDLDSCLSPADEPGQQLFAPAFDSITNANRGSHSASILQSAFADMWRLPFDFVAEKYRFTPAMKAAGWQVLAQLEVTTPMAGYGDLAVPQGPPWPKIRSHVRLSLPPREQNPGVGHRAAIHGYLHRRH